MAIETRNYLVSKSYPVLKLPIGQVPNVTNKNFIRRDGVLVNGFNSMKLYISDGGGGYTLLPPGAYDPQATLDKGWTNQEATENDGTGASIYSQWRLIDNSYINTDLFVDFTDWGTLSDNDATFKQVGGVVNVSSTGTIELSEGRIRTRVNIDTTTADVALTIPDGGFEGQQVLLKETGNGNKSIILGSGYYAGVDSGGMYLVNRSILCIWNDEDKVWEMDDCVVAEWEDGATVIKLTTSGVFNIIYNGQAITYASSDTLQVIITLPFTAIDTDYLVKYDCETRTGVNITTYGSGQYITEVKTITGFTHRFYGGVFSAGNSLNGTMIVYGTKY